jgi:7,8-dihydro-6-hydroxymethylpterin-pyrophosphokinase
MGHRLIEEELERQRQQKEDERNARMDIIAQNGNDGEHYEDEDLTVSDVEATYSWINPTSYKLDVSMIHDLEDIKDILEALNFTLHVNINDASPTQRRLIDNGTFKKQ